jgi:hypothetical protein
MRLMVAKSMTVRAGGAEEPYFQIMGGCGKS